MNDGFLDFNGLKEVVGEIKSRVKLESSLPANPSDRDVILYIGEDIETYKKGHIYQFRGTEWVDLTPSNGTAPKEVVTSVKSFPNNAVENQTVVYIGPSTSEFTKNHSYKAQLNAKYFKKIDDSSGRVTEPHFMWTDGTNIYYSYDYEHYIFNKETSEFEPCESISDPDYAYNGQYVWTDKINTYCSNNSSKVFDKETSTWKNKEFYILEKSTLYGQYIWSDGTNAYYSEWGNQYTLENGNWVTKEWKDPNGNDFYFYGNYIWSDGINTYYSEDSRQYVLENGNWVTKEWKDSDGNNFYFYGENIWTDGINTYYSYDNDQWVLENGVWVKKEWKDSDGNNFRFYRQFIWSDGTNTYYSESDRQYTLENGNWVTKEWKDPNGNDFYFNGNYIWSDGINTYYSELDRQYVLSKETSIFKRTAFVSPNENGELYVDAVNIWSDGTNTYYSYWDQQYILENGVWVAKEWNFMEPYYLRGRYLWSIEGDIYYSNTGNGWQYAFNKETSTWETKTWPISGLNKIFIWHSKDTIGYSDGDKQYILNRKAEWTDITPKAASEATIKTVVAAAGESACRGGN